MKAQAMPGMKRQRQKRRTLKTLQLQTPLARAARTPYRGNGRGDQGPVTRETCTAAGKKGSTTEGEECGGKPRRGKHTCSVDPDPDAAFLRYRTATKHN